MLDDGELQALARAVAALDGEDVERLDEAVRARREEKETAERDRIAKLRAMDDDAVIDEVIGESVEYPERWESDVALKILRDAGFVRELSRQRISFVFPGGHSIELFGSKEDLGCVKDHLCDAVPGIKYSKGA
jgi:hypothetical protein